MSEMKTKVASVLQMHKAHNDLDECKTFKGDAGRARYAIARNIRRLQQVVDDFDAAREKLVNRMADKEGKVPDALLAEFKTEVRGMLDQEVSVDLWKLQWDWLNVDENKVKGSTLAELEPVLEYPEGL